MLGYETMLFGQQSDWESFQTFVLSVESGDTLVIDNTSMMTPQYATNGADSTAVRQICCGIGTLSKSFQVVAEEEINTAEYRRALEHYGRGVRAIFSLKPTTTTLPSTILASLLFECFEWMAGHTEATIKHHNHSVAMMWQYVDLLIEEQGVPLKRLNLSEMEQAMFDTLERLDTLPWVEGFGENERIKTSSPARRFPHGCRHRLDMDEIPKSFNSTQQAFTWWHFTQHNMAHSLHPLKTSQVADSEKAAAYDECAALLETWHSSFMPLLLHAKQHRSSHGSRWSRAMILESLYVETISALHSRHKQNSNVLPAVQPIYRDLIAMSRQMAGEKPLNGIETLGRENSIIRPIVFVLLKCRDPDIVRESKAVLESLQGGINMAWTMLFSMNNPKKTKSIVFCDRAWGWYLTTSGCSSGAHIFDGIL
ncbi:C6 zinc finger domain-containing protein [Colletotrichum karsti]|uniref:C6 zinc finger domain-containing protein n=1 Tax=Colletotrichum karsti TaxID=1095194 RepID=A0A9P6HUQ4_9PEZI|nr:C6 zinc finger domain-containing protein [Colletotrichum karsti]KAF9871583.1 C6 zinc finger domain-containing protein [Colletotrichum karsti]